MAISQLVVDVQLTLQGARMAHILSAYLPLFLSLILLGEIIIFDSVEFPVDIAVERS